MLTHIVDTLIPKTRPTNHKRRNQNLQNQKINNIFCHMHQTKINLTAASFQPIRVRQNSSRLDEKR